MAKADEIQDRVGCAWRVVQRVVQVERGRIPIWAANHRLNRGVVIRALEPEDLVGYVQAYERSERIIQSLRCVRCVQVQPKGERSAPMSRFAPVGRLARCRKRK